jgi:predicted nucleic acid-binding protein
MIVADANVIAYLLVEGRKTDLARQLHALDPQWRMPPFWRAEFLNVLALQVQHGGAPLLLAERTWESAVALFHAGEIQVDEVNALRLAARYRITAYDAQYVELARQLGVSCVSEDRELARKCPGFVMPMAALVP